MPKGSGAGVGGCPTHCLYPLCSMEDVAMRNFDFTPFSRSSIGFDHLIDLLNNPQLTEDQGGYPPTISFAPVRKPTASR